MNTDFAARTCLYLRHNEKIAQGVNFMGTIVQRSLSDGTLRYRAEIRVNRKGLPVYKEVRFLAQSALQKNGSKSAKSKLRTILSKCKRSIDDSCNNRWFMKGGYMEWVIGGG